MIKPTLSLHLSWERPHASSPTGARCFLKGLVNTDVLSMDVVLQHILNVNGDLAYRTSFNMSSRNRYLVIDRCKPILNLQFMSSYMLQIQDFLTNVPNTCSHCTVETIGSSTEGNPLKVIVVNILKKCPSACADLGGGGRGAAPPPYFRQIL